MPEITVRLAAQADIREAALWYDAQRPGLGTEFTLRIDALLGTHRAESTSVS